MASSKPQRTECPVPAEHRRGNLPLRCTTRSHTTERVQIAFLVEMEDGRQQRKCSQCVSENMQRRPKADGHGLGSPFGNPLAANRKSSGEDVPLLSSDTPPQPKPKRDALLHFDRSDEGKKNPKNLLHPATIPTAGNRIETGPPKIVSPLQHSLEIACSTVTDRTEQKNKFHRSSTKEEASL